MSPFFRTRPRTTRAFPAASEGAASNAAATADAGTETSGRDAGLSRNGSPAHESHPELPHPRTFEGRPLDRPHEDIEDQGLAFDLGTLIDRRRALGVFGAGASVFALAACSTSGATTSGASGSATATASATPSPTATYDEEMPQETAGPYPGDGSNGQDVLEISGVQRQDITKSIDGKATADGVPMTLTMNIVDMVKNNGPMTGAAVYVWHCDAQGNYSMYSDGLEDATYLRGVQVVGSDGTVTFKSIFPGCYMGRWAHIHFEVFPNINSITDASKAILTSQIALPEDACKKVYALSEYEGSATALAQTSLKTDNVFSDGSDLQLATVSGNTSSGYTVKIDVPIDTSTTPEAVTGGPGGGAGAPPGT